MTRSVGILAYGSLIGEPGDELKPKIVRQICCRTPFKVEYARTSSTRKGAPTLVPYRAGGHVSAQILVVDLAIREAKDRLYRREFRKTHGAYTASKSFRIETRRNFQGIDDVIYASFVANIEGLTAGKLARHAISSARKLDNGKDGISYLMNAMKAGISTPLSESYKAEILKQTGTTSLSYALTTCRIACCSR